MATGLFELTKWHETSTERGIGTRMRHLEKGLTRSIAGCPTGCATGSRGVALTGENGGKCGKTGRSDVANHNMFRVHSSLAQLPLAPRLLLNGEHSAASLFAVPLVFCGFAVVHLLASSDGFLDFSDDFLRLPFRHCLSSVCPIRLERMAGLQTIGKGA